MRWLLLLVFACSHADAPRWQAAGGAPRAGGSLTVAWQTGLATLDPAIAYDETSVAVVHHIVDGLVGYAADSAELVPRLAERWTISPDGLLYTFTLRQATYEDGTPIVAHDFKRSFERTLSRADSPYASRLAGLVGAQAMIDGKATHCTGIVVVDNRTLRLELTAPNAAMLYELAMAYASPLTEEAMTANLRRAPLASGPYKVVSWDEGQRIVLVRRARFYDPARQRIERITMLENTPRDLQFMMFERGELDAAERPSGSDLRWLESQPAWAPHLMARPLMNAFGSRMNTQVKPFDDRRVRQAMNYALDKTKIAKLLMGTSAPAHGVLAPGAFGRDDGLPPYPHDPAKARALLAEAGLRDGFAIDYVTVVDEDAEKLAVSLQADLAEVGIRMSITQLSFTAYGDAIGKRTGPAFSLGSWLGDYPDPLSLLDPLFHSRNISDENSTNSTFFSNPQLDRLLDAARGEVDRDKRAALYRQAEKLLYDEAPWIWGYHQLVTEVVHPYVRDYRPHPVWVRDYTAAWLDLGPDGDRVKR